MTTTNSQPSQKCKHRRSRKKLSDQDVYAYVLWSVISPLFPKDQMIFYSEIINTLKDKIPFSVETEIETLVWLYLKSNHVHVYDNVFDIFVKYKLVEETAKLTSFNALSIIFKTPSHIIQSRIDKALVIYKLKNI